MPVTDDYLRKQIGLSDQEILDLETKVWALDPAQRKVLAISTPKPDDAAKTLGRDVTADRLLEFLRARAPREATMVICFNGIGGGHVV